MQMGCNMRTTLDIPEDLMDEAMKVSHQHSKTAVIIEALEELVRRHKTAQIKRYKGRVDLDIDLDKLRDRQ